MPIGEPVKLDKQPPAEADTTKAGFGQAEPGRDVFGEHPHNDLKSKEGQAPRKVEGEVNDQEKVISSQNAESVTEAPKIAEEATSETVESSSLESTSAPGTTTTSTEETATPHHEHSEGPAVQEEAEAERARSELFSDA